MKPEFRLIIAGSRGFSRDDYPIMESLCDKLLSRVVDTHEITIISGCALGADTQGQRYAFKKGYSIKNMPADWDEHAKAAGPIRNRQMAKFASETEGGCVIFWTGASRGSLSMAQEAEKAGLSYKIYNYVENRFVKLPE
jgi:hypothetical protein